MDSDSSSGDAQFAGSRRRRGSHAMTCGRSSRSARQRSRAQHRDSEPRVTGRSTERPDPTRCTEAGSGTSQTRPKLVLCYHALSEDWLATLSITPMLLRWHVRKLLGRGLRPERFTEMVVGGEGQPTMAVTFDDAFRSILTLGLPILRDLGVPASVFVPTGHVGGGPMRWPGIDEWSGGPHEHELAGCTWDDVAELAEAGWEIGSHTRTHPRLTLLSDHEVRTELVDSKAECE